MLYCLVTVLGLFTLQRLKAYHSPQDLCRPGGDRLKEILSRKVFATHRYEREREATFPTENWTIFEVTGVDP